MIRSKKYYQLLIKVYDDYANSIQALKKGAWEINSYRDMLDAFGDWSGSDVWVDVKYKDLNFTDLCSDISRELIDYDTDEIIPFGKFINDLKAMLNLK